jgi:hypothetical protein
MNCLPQVRLSGPTLFAPLINTAIGYSSAPETQTHQYYNVLLILTGKTSYGALLPSWVLNLGWDDGRRRDQ